MSCVLWGVLEGGGVFWALGTLQALQGGVLRTPRARGPGPGPQGGPEPAPTPQDGNETTQNGPKATHVPEQPLSIACLQDSRWTQPFRALCLCICPGRGARL